MPATWPEAEAGAPGPLARLLDRLRRNWAGLLGRPGFVRWAMASPLTRRVARRHATELHDIMTGFVHAQVLLAFTELELARHLAAGPLPAAALAARCGLAPARMEMLARAAAALGLLLRESDGRYALGRHGQVLRAVPGLDAMIRHHRLFYADLADPVALLRGGAETRLARFWPYVAGPGAAIDPAQARDYSALMRATQAMVAEEVLDAVPLAGVRRLMDVGGGTGAFLAAAATRWPGLALTLLDLPQVLESAALDPGLPRDRLTLAPGSFREGSLPGGADAISLVRVLFDHEDATVRGLLARVHAALPPGGLLLVAEPMAGGRRPNRYGDAYFGFYTMAMGTGRPRSPAEHAALLAGAGFAAIREHRTVRPFITGVLTARRPA